MIVNLGVFTWLLSTGMNKFLASPLAIEASIVSNFFLNNFWTFRQRRTRTRKRIKGLKFNAVSLVALGISYATFVLLSHLFPRRAPQVHQLIGILPATAVNYFLNSYWTFREDGDQRRHDASPPYRDRRACNSLRTCRRLPGGVRAAHGGAVLWPGIHYPDEVMQSLEQAHRLVFGSGLVPWEFRDGARSWLLPGMLAVPMWLGDAVAPDRERTDGWRRR